MQIKLLKDALAAWQKEVEKKPPTMSVNDALETLGLQPDVTHDESKVKKVQSSDMFVNKLYPHLLVHSKWQCQSTN